MTLETSPGITADSPHPLRATLNGALVRIAADGYVAEITSVGASLRSLAFHGRDLVRTFDPEALRPAFSGAALAPWPNRLGDGRYEFEGEEHQVALSEPARGNALHGLVAWADWQVSELAESAVTLRTAIVAQSGYPFPLELTSRFWLDADGLRWSIEARNTGSRPAPYGTGSHAYLLGGSGRVDDWTLQLAAEDVLEVDPDRLLPVGLRRLDDSEGWQRGRTIGETFIDHAFSGFSASHGETTVEVRDAAGTGSAITWDPAALPWVQVHTADRPDPALHRTGLAVEPMTCPPDAFRTGTDLVVIAPGGRHRASWRIHALG